MDHNAPPDFKYYCELLTNIQQVSVSTSAASGAPPLSAVRLHPSRRALTFQYAGDDRSSSSARVLLPAPVKVSQHLTPGTTYRLPLQQQQNPTSTAPASEPQSSAIPWPASRLDKASSLHCRGCAAEIVREGGQHVHEWKDLPSENWADLMDFWHCHKPSVTDSDKAGGRYAGLANVRAQRGVGLVEMMFVLLDQRDCENIEFNLEENAHEQSRAVSSSSAELTCKVCKSVLGVYDENASGFRLMKWSLSVNEAGDPANELITYPTEQWVAAQLLALVESQGQRKFIIQRESFERESRDGSDESTRFQIWIFNPHTVITTHIHPTPTAAVKVYYQAMAGIPAPASTHGGTKASGTALKDLETVYLPSRVYDDVWGSLEESNRELPEEIRNWGECWKTAWLQRFPAVEG